MREECKGLHRVEKEWQNSLLLKKNKKKKRKYQGHTSFFLSFFAEVAEILWLQLSPWPCLMPVFLSLEHCVLVCS